MIDFNEKKGFICDMDGVIYHGNRILPGVVEFIDWLKANDKGYLFLTNNSGCTPKELNQKLARMGLDVPEEHFYTSALATAAFIKEQSPGCSAYVIGEAGLLNALYDAGITMNDINPDYVIVGEGKAYSLDTLTKAANLVLEGAKLIGANSDISGPIENGIAPACRALIAPIEMATGTEAYFCGKPNPLMMRTGLKILGCHSGEAVMIGDRMDTDVISGMESGMSTVRSCPAYPRARRLSTLPTVRALSSTAWAISSKWQRANKPILNHTEMRKASRFFVANMPVHALFDGADQGKGCREYLPVLSRALTQHGRKYARQAFQSLYKNAVVAFTKRR